MAEEKKNSVGLPDDEDMEVITLEYDDGSKEDCEILGVFDYGDKDYIALLPDNGTDDVYIYRYQEYDDASFELMDITDDDLFKRVAHEFEKIMEDPEVEE